MIRIVDGLERLTEWIMGLMLGATLAPRQNQRLGP